ncbi:MAG: tetratricopeptide repeat protein, partial [Opitutae bacterium]
FTVNYHPDLSAEEIFAVYREYDERFGSVHRSAWRDFANSRETGRRLKLGYVSPDFRQHSARHVVEPLLAHHDKSVVEVYAYAELKREDAVTARYRGYVEHWIPTLGLSDEALTERIRADGIDVLVDLAGHTAHNRLRVFARKPAPVSVSWLGYGYTTGLSAIDYYLTDEASAPSGSEGLFAEVPWRIATPAYSYRPSPDMGEVGSLPAQQRGHVTFGTLTRSIRVNHRTIRVWAAILKAVPDSCLVMDSRTFKDASMQERLAALFARHGIARDRLEIGFHSPPWDVLRGIDIGLDCFPHNSGTTLFETLHMGVPYITLAGRPSVGRLGSSILQGIGHPEWIAGSEYDYVAKAVDLAGDIARLSKIRSTLRSDMEQSPLADEGGFARKVEEAYRGMWQTWCKNAPAAGPDECPGGPAKKPEDIAVGDPQRQPLPPIVEQDLLQAVARHEAGRLQEAEQLYRAILQTRPDHPEANHNMGVLAGQRKQPADGLTYFLAALEADPTCGRYWLSYAGALIQSGQVEDARQVLSVARQQGLEGDEVAALELRLEASSQVAAAPRIPPENRKKSRKSAPPRGKEPGPQEINALAGLFNNGQFAEAASLAREMTKRFPRHWAGWKMLGVVLKQMGQSADALAPMQKAVALSPGDAEAHNNLGIVLNELGRLDEAEASYRRALQISPEYAQAHSNLGATLQDLGRLDEAEASYRRALKIAPDYAKAHSNLGAIL